MIQCVCLNPVHQKTLTIENFRINAVNRANTNIIESGAGKGVNVARVLKTLGGEPLITGFIGGGTGKFIEDYLSQEGLLHDFVHTINTTRTCTTILDPVQHSHTELVEEGKPVSSDEVRKMSRMFEKHLSQSTLVTIAGTAPQHVPDDMYTRFIEMAHTCHLPVLVDTQKTLLRNAFAAKPLLIKINKQELGDVFGDPVTSLESLNALIGKVLHEGVEWVVITDGENPTLVAHQEKRWEMRPPTVQPVNPIGSGDAMLAGMAFALLDKRGMLAAIQYGLACGTANTLTLTPGDIRNDDVKRLEQAVVVQCLV